MEEGKIAKSDSEILGELSLKDEKDLTAEERILQHILRFQAAFIGRKVRSIFVHPRTFGCKTPKEVRGVPVIKDKSVKKGGIENIAY